MTTSNNVTVTINNQTITADLATIAALLDMAVEASTASAKPNREKAQNGKKADKAHEVRSKHDAILDSKRIERMTKTAIGKFETAGFEVKSSKQGKWIWVYPCGKSNGKGRSPEFKAVKLPKGWKHSPKRGAFFRDFS